MVKAVEEVGLRTALQAQTKLCFSTNHGEKIYYTVLREIGRGASCIVYEVAHETTAGVIKLYRLKEFYPYQLQIGRDADGRLVPDEAQRHLFEEMKQKTREDFKRANQLFCADGTIGMLTNQLNVYDCNGTTYVVSAFSAEKTLASYKAASIKECISLVKQVAYIVGKIHRQGYLYLDMKPQNVLVAESFQSWIQLFDFDSLISQKELEADRAKKHCELHLSYSEGFAAIELETAKLNHIGYQTDVFAVGALLFYLLFGYAATAPDCEQDAEYPFENIQYCREKCDDRLFDVLTDFFHHTLANYYLDRLPDMTEVSEILSEIEVLADENHPRIYSTKFAYADYVVGREDEFRKIDAFISDRDEKCMYLTGMGGIGKSTLIRGYLQKRRQMFDTILYMQYDATMENTIASDQNIHINTLKNVEGARSKTRYFDRKVQKIRELLEDKKALLVIDNFSGAIDGDTLKVLQIGCKVIIVCRKKPEGQNGIELEVEAIANQAVLQKIFEKHLKRAIGSLERAVFENIVEKVKGHTLALELIAKQIERSHISLSEANALVQEYGFSRMAPEKIVHERDGLTDRTTIGRLIDALFEANKLSEEQKVLLKTFSLIGIDGIDIVWYKEILKPETFDDVNEVVADGWLNLQGTVLSMHPVIEEAVRRWQWTNERKCQAEVLLGYFYRRIKLEAAKNNSSVKPHLKKFYKKPADYGKLEKYLLQAEKILGKCKKEKEIRNSESYRLLWYVAVLYMPRYREDFIMNETENILREKTGSLLRGEDGKSLKTIMKLYHNLIIIHMERGNLDAAGKRLLEAKRLDGKSKDVYVHAQYYDLLSDYYDILLDGSYDAETAEEKELLGLLLQAIEKALQYAKKGMSKNGGHLYAKNLLAKAAILLRSGYGEPAEIRRLIRAAGKVIAEYTGPYAEVRHQYDMVCAWYHAFADENLEKTEKHINRAKKLAGEIAKTDLNKIDETLVPCANIYLELRRFHESMELLLEAVIICLEKESLEVYRRKRRELCSYLRDVANQTDEPQKYMESINLLDSGSVDSKYKKVIIERLLKKPG